MKEIKVDGNTYYLKEDVETRIKSLKKNKGMELIRDCNMIDGPSQAAIGVVELGDDSVVTKISIENLQKAIKFMEFCDVDSMSFAWTKDFPLCIGKVNGDKLTGYIIAPRVDTN